MSGAADVPAEKQPVLQRTDTSSDRRTGKVMESRYETGVKIPSEFRLYCLDRMRVIALGVAALN